MRHLLLIIPALMLAACQLITIKIIQNDGGKVESEISQETKNKSPGQSGLINR